VKARPGWDHIVQLSAPCLPSATYLTCRPVLLTSEGCLASQDPGIMGWMGWLSSSLEAEKEKQHFMIS
jgi:hypothetical protein